MMSVCFIYQKITEELLDEVLLKIARLESPSTVKHHCGIVRSLDKKIEVRRLILIFVILHLILLL